MAALCLFAGSVAQAQTTPNIQQQFDAAFQHMLQDPSNLDKSFKYAELGIQIGDYEAAISALERMLLYNPDLPRVRLELGVLYFRLGSYAIARTYLTRAVEGDNVPDDVRARVAVFLDEIDNRLSNHRFSGSVYSGIRYQDNANAGPERPAIRVFDAEFQLDSESTKKTDWNAFVSANFRHVYDPQSHSGDVLETNVLLYVSQQDHQHQLDLVFTEITSGPRGQFMREFIENASWRPHIIGSLVNLDDSPYYYSYGAGVDLDKQFTAKTNGALSTSFVHKSYRPDIGRTTARLQNGSETNLALDVRHQVTDAFVVTASTSTTNLDTEDSRFANSEYSLGLGASVTYGPPENVKTGPWTTSLSGAVLYTRYHAIDTDVDSFRKRKDQEYRATLLTSVPVNDAWSVTSTVARTVVDSNFKNYTYTNWAMSLGASMRF